VHLSRRAALSCACAVLVIAALPAAGQFVPRVDYTAEGTSGVVTVNGRTAIRFRVPHRGLAPLDRARMTASRLAPLATGGWRFIVAKPVGRSRAQLVVGRHFICSATSADAKANRMSAPALARSWAVRLRWLFSLPPITLTPAAITVPENENRWVLVGGAALGAIATADGNPAVAVSTLDPARRAVIVFGKSVGRSVVEVICQGSRATLIVTVRRYAARLARTQIVEVTGDPAPDWLLESVAARMAPETLVLEPGAAAIFGRPQLSAASLPRGERVRALVPVKVSGQGLIPAALLAPVEVFNRPIAHTPAADLFYSNNPERITRYATLFAGRLELDSCKRLLYHHQNRTGKRIRLAIELVNAGSSPASVHTVSGVSSPLVDTVVVGYVAGRIFLRDYLRDVGQIYRIPPKSRLVVYAEEVRRIRTASGIVDLRLLSGENVYVRVLAQPTSPEPLAEGQVAPITAQDIPTNLSRHVYTSPAKQLDATYIIGGQWGFIRIGKYAIRDAFEEGQLDGNYGVIYEINARVENPTDQARNVRVIFEPTAGPASGVFVVNGRIIGTRMVVPPRDFELASVRVPPGEGRDISIVTMPLAGSAYPATIVLRP